MTASRHDVPTEPQRRLRLLREMLDGMTDLVWIKDAEGRFLDVNHAMARVVGCEPEEVLGRRDHDFAPKDLADAYRADDESVVRGSGTLRRVERIVDAKSGGVRWVETIKTAVYDDDGSLIGITGVARDISSQQEAEEGRLQLMEELKRQHARLNDLIANVPGVVWEESLDGSYRYVNDYIEVMLGYSKAEYLERFSSVQELIPDGDRETFATITAAMVAENRGGTNLFRLIRKDGRVIWCESHCSVIVGPDGTPTGVRGVSMDVTERVLADIALRQTEERFRHLANAAPVMIWTTNASGEAEFQNKRITEFTGDDDLIGNRWLSVVHPDDFERAKNLMTQAHVEHYFTPFEMRARRYDGDYREIYIAATPQQSADGTFAGFVGTCVDLTDHRRLERHLEQSNRMAGLGRLAATIAHEINNVLMAIQPYSEVIRRAPSQAVLDRVGERIASAVQRGGRITHQILRYAHAAEPSIRALAVRKWLTANCDEWQTLLGSGVEVRIDADDLRVLADPHQLQQIFVNLATNASEAMKGRGRFTITARSAQRWPGLNGRSHGFVHFTIEDTGPGISSEIAARIFEPLFTTHSAGTGLGLAIVHEVVRRHGGAISVDADRAGACFHLALPATSAEEVAKHEACDVWPSWIKRVLIVEDEATVADALKLLLELDDVEVSIVYRGSEAVEAVDAFKPDLVILDIGLPDISGTRVFELIRHAHPQLPVVFATGHAPELEHESVEFSGPVAHLLKPFDTTSLINTVRMLR
ncbi:MAG TPA: PAS domain S-box protein [Thermoanaerobaculia bacterium]